MAVGEIAVMVSLGCCRLLEWAGEMQKEADRASIGAVLTQRIQQAKQNRSELNFVPASKQAYRLVNRYRTHFVIQHRLYLHFSKTVSKQHLIAYNSSPCLIRLVLHWLLPARSLLAALDVV